MRGRQCRCYVRNGAAIFRISIFLGLLSVPSGVFGQGSPGVINLGASNAQLFEDWGLVLFALDEDVVGRDLNGDGDMWDYCSHVLDLSTGEIRNLRLVTQAWVRLESEDWIYSDIAESQQGEDLNGDGDTADMVHHIFNLATCETTNLGLAGEGSARVVGSWLLFPVEENKLGEDLNGDGDMQDVFLHIYDPPTGETPNLELTGELVFATSTWLTTSGSEVAWGEDLNGDGDMVDEGIVFVQNLSTGETRNLGLVWSQMGLLADLFLLVGVPEEGQAKDLNGDGDQTDEVFHVHNLATGETKNLGLAGYPQLAAGSWLVIAVSEDCQGVDLNGDGDTEDNVLHVHNLATGETTNLGLAAWILSEHEDWVLMLVSEEGEGEDLNGDGDTEDNVLHVHNLAAGETTNLGLALEDCRTHGDWLLFSVIEEKQGQDLNGDGDQADEVVHVHNLATGETRNLGLADNGFGGPRLISGSLLMITVSENWQGKDLNGDGDTADCVDHTHNLSTGETRNLGVSLNLASGTQAAGDWLLTTLQEATLGKDLNGDGDQGDNVPHVYNLATSETRNLGLAVGWARWEHEDWLQLGVYEGAQSQDLNGDGDQKDTVIHFHNLSTGETENLGLSLNVSIASLLHQERSMFMFSVSEPGQGQDLNADGDTEDRAVAHLHNLSTGETTTLGLGVQDRGFLVAEGDWLLLTVSESQQGEDLNGDGQIGSPGAVVHVVDLRTLGEPEEVFRRGDASADAAIDIGDAIFTLSYLFAKGAAPACLDAADANDGGGIDIADAIAILSHLFGGAGPLSKPFGECGIDPTPDDLDCGSFPPCEGP